eukprot:m.104473 g.104473  ORF g.104473 m.104473 type:complete len:442 (-) comp14176_c0_seq3:24-1349(-)
MERVDQRGNEALARENRELKLKIEKLERENRDLRRSLYDVNMRLVPAKPSSKGNYFDVGAMLAADNSAQPAPSEALSPSTDGRQFAWVAELKGHAGPVYCVQYSPCGRFLLSGSFDKTARLWDAIQQREISVLGAHSMPVADLSWHLDSKHVATGSLDGTVRLWQTDVGLTSEHACDGMVQVVAYVPTEPHVCLAGTSRGTVAVIDPRQERAALAIRNDCMVTSLYPYRGDRFFISGDAHGHIKTWDLRQEQSIEVVNNGPKPSPVAHITVSRGQNYFEEGRFMAVNGYDSVLRVFDRGGMPPTSRLEFHRSVQGHTVQNWPIRSNFFHGAEHQLSSKLVLPRDPGSDAAAGEADQTSDQPVSVDSSLLLASGSADHNVFLYDVGGREESSGPLQVLSGHHDRVYGVHFHPKEPFLASCSADATVRLWSAKFKGSVPLASS